MGLNLGDMALAAGVSEPTVRRWVREGCPTVSKGGNGVAYEFDPARVKAWRDERDRLEGEADAERERQIAEAQAELFAGEKLAPVGFDPKRHREELNLEHEAIRLGLLKKTLIPAEDVRRTAAAMLGIMRQRLLAFVPNLTRSAGLTPEQQQEGDKQIRALLEELQLAILEWTPSTSTDSASPPSPAPPGSGAPAPIS